MVRRVGLVVIAAVALALVGMGPAHAVYTVSLAGSTATITGDASVVDQLEIGTSGGNLTHDGSLDWDPGAGGDQLLADAPGSTVVVNAGDGIDIVSVGNSVTPLSTLAATITINGEGGADFLNVFAASGGSDTLTIDGNGVQVPGGGHVTWTDSQDQVNIHAGDGADHVDVTASPTSPQVLVYAEGGDDTIKLANGTALSSSPGTDSAFRGGPGTDTVDYSAWTTPVGIDLGKTAEFVGKLTKDNVVPPSGSAASGDAVVDFTDLATNAFTYELDVEGLTATEITDAHIHQGAVGTNGAALFTFGAGLSWSDPDLPVGSSPSDAIDAPITDPAVTEPALRAGGTYVDVHAASGDIRGQLTPDPDDGYGGSGTGLPRVYTVENVIGGSGNDTFTGSVVANHFDCGPGQDTATAGPGDTLVNCDKGGTGSLSALKPKAKTKGKRVTIDTGTTASCPATSPSACAVNASATAKVGKKSVKLGSMTAAVAAAQTLRVVLKVPKKGLKAWRKAGKLKVAFTITIAVPDGTGATLTKTLKLKLKTPKKK